MKTIFAAAIALFISFSAFAQNPNLDFKYALKGYNQASYSYNYDYWEGMKRKNSSFSWFRPVAGFQWQNKKGNSHEVYLTHLSKSSGITKYESKGNATGASPNINEHTYNSFIFYAGYDYQLNFNKNNDSKLVPSLGFGLNPYFERVKVTHDYEYSTRSEMNRYGINLMLTPRLMYHVSPKVFLDLNVPICLLENYWEVSSEFSSIYPPKDKETNQLTKELPNFYNLRLGLGLKL